MIKDKKNKGFTLIELMVVISIIALISSVVIVSISRARERALATKFRQEMRQFIYALELYRTDKKMYPHEGGVFNQAHGTSISNSNVISRSFPTESNANNVPWLAALVLPYVKTLPYVPQNSYNQSQIAWSYTGIAPAFNPVRCVGDSLIPRYVIAITNQNPLLFSVFSDWPHSQMLIGSVWTTNTSVRCFSGGK